MAVSENRCYLSFETRQSIALCLAMAMHQYPATAIRRMASAEIFANSGTLAANSGSLKRDNNTGGLSLPSLSMCVRKISVYGVLTFEENNNHLLLGDQLCQELNRARLQVISRATPPEEGMI